MDKITKQNQTSYDTHATEWALSVPANVKYAYLEKPAMEAELPDSLVGKTVLCIGTGSGEELASIVMRNPKKIVAIDTSEKLLHFAHEQYPDVEYHTMDMQALDFPDNSFDFVYSSLAFHYTQDWDALLSGIYRVMKPGATLLFSTHNPEYWGKHPTGVVATNARGMKLTEHTAILPGGVEIVYYNHPNTDSISEAVQHAGFVIKNAHAPHVKKVPTHILKPNERKKYENLVKTNTETPFFYVVQAIRN